MTITPPYVPYRQFMPYLSERKARAAWVRSELVRQGAQIFDLPHGVRVIAPHIDVIAIDLSLLSDREILRFDRVGA
jgi:hypothetical protein